MEFQLVIYWEKQWCFAKSPLNKTNEDVSGVEKQLVILSPACDKIAGNNDNGIGLSNLSFTKMKGTYHIYHQQTWG